MGDVTDFRPSGAVRDPATGDDITAMTDRLESAWRAAGDLQSDVANAAGILEVFADSPSQVDSEQAWLQVAYAARQFQRHAKDLAAELEKIELGVMALRRAIKASPTPAEGGAA